MNRISAPIINSSNIKLQVILFFENNKAILKIQDSRLYILIMVIINSIKDR
jgi:hypothetical protein